MSKARQKGTQGENFFLGFLRVAFGEKVERAPLKGINDQGDFVNVPWMHEAKNTVKPLFLQWAKVCEAKAGRDWVLLWKGDLRTAGNGPYVLTTIEKYMELLTGALPTKACSKCLEERPLSDFNRREDGTLRADCKVCKRSDALQRNYGISLAEYDRMAAEQNNRCAICLNEETVERMSTVRPLSVDHDHATGEVRALLCQKCNQGLGLFGESRVVLLSAKRYLEKYMSLLDERNPF